MKKKITEYTFLEFEYLSSPKYSPDGKTIAFLSKHADYAENRYSQDIYIITEEKKQRKLTNRGDVGCFVWVSDKEILFTTGATGAKSQYSGSYKDCDPKSVICKISIDGGESKVSYILPLSGVSELTLIDGERMVFLAEYRIPERDDQMVDAIPNKEEFYHTFDEIPFLKTDPGIQDSRRTRAYLYNLRSGELNAISEENEMVTRISCDDSAVLYSSASYNDNMVKNQDVDLYLYEFDSGKKIKVMDKSRLWLRESKVYGELWQDKILVLGQEGDIYGRMESPKCWLIDRKTLQMKLFCELEYNIGYRNITSDHNLCGGMLKAYGDRVYFTQTINYNTYVRYFTADGKWSDILTEDGSVDSFDLYGDNMIYCGFHGDHPGEIYENGIQVSHMNDIFTEEYQISTPEHFTFINSEGYEIDGWIMKPIDYVPGNSYPGVLHIHGGPRCCFGEVFFHEHQMWANDGYFVFFCNPRGSEGKGDDFANCWGENWGVVDYNDLMEFTDEALKRCADCDPDRVGVLGGSFGGFMTNWIIGHTDRFSAAVSQRSFSNMTSFEYATMIGYHWIKNFLGKSTAEDAEYLWKKSPLAYVHNVKTPTLFIHSNHDNVCWQDQGIQMFTGIKLTGTPAKFCFFKGEGHELSRSGRPVPRLARLLEIHDWFNKYLKE